MFVRGMGASGGSGTRNSTVMSNTAIVTGGRWTVRGVWSSGGSSPSLSYTEARARSGSLTSTTYLAPDSAPARSMPLLAEVIA